MLKKLLPYVAGIVNITLGDFYCEQKANFSNELFVYFCWAYVVLYKYLFFMFKYEKIPEPSHFGYYSSNFCK